MILTVITMIIVTAVMIGFNALYVAGEFAAVSARKTRIEQAATEGNPVARALLPVLEDQHRLDNYIAASQVGITLSSVVLGIYGQQQIAPRIAPLLASLPFVSELAAAGIAATLVLIILTTLQVILGELVPKSLTLRSPERIALLTALPMRWSADVILRPLIILLNGSGTLLMSLLGIRHIGGHGHVHSPEEIKLLIEQSHEGGLLEDQEHDLLDSALRFSELKVGAIVVPRTKMVAASIDTPINEVLRLAAEADYTRIPIYEEDTDHIVGFVHLKELFQLSYAGQAKDVRPILREAAFVPETTPIDEVWNRLNEQQSYLAIVLDEYGGTMGMVTREDVLEELFGEVQDEFDPEAIESIESLSDSEYRVRGDVPVTYLNDHLGLSLSAEAAYTIGGVFVNALGRLPEPGDTVELEGVSLRATEVRHKAVEELIVTLSQPPVEEDAG